MQHIKLQKGSFAKNNTATNSTLVTTVEILHNALFRGWPLVPREFHIEWVESSDLRLKDGILCALETQPPLLRTPIHNRLKITSASDI